MALGPLLKLIREKMLYTFGASTTRGTASTIRSQTRQFWPENNRQSQEEFTALNNPAKYNRGSIRHGVSAESAIGRSQADDGYNSDEIYVMRDVRVTRSPR